MLKLLKYLFQKDRNPRRGLLLVEWIVLGYMLLTLLLMLFTYTKVVNPEPMIWGRFRILMTTLALWAVYRMVPCRFTHLCRITCQMVLLSWWYPDTYELNRVFPSYDHVFATLEQQLFGSQPALWLAERFSHPVVSELMHLGYYSYFPLMVLITLYYFFQRYGELNMLAFVIMSSFFTFYLIFIFLPVTGPQYYYVAVGADQIAQGHFPSLGHYFASHQERVTLPGWADGYFYHLVDLAHDAGERPTAAFPSSHVGITTIILLLAIHTRSRRLVWTIMPFFVLMCFATVYIQAHYVVDAIAGLLTGVVLYCLFRVIYKNFSD